MIVNEVDNEVKSKYGNSGGRNRLIKKLPKSKNFKNSRLKIIRYMEKLNFLDPNGQATLDYDE